MQPVPSTAVACNHPASYWAARGYKSTAIVLQIAVTRSATRTGGDPASCSVPFCEIARCSQQNHNMPRALHPFISVLPTPLRIR